MVEPSVCVVIPTRRRPRQVLQAVASALGQTQGVTQVVVVIDGEDDDTVAALGTVRDTRLEIIQREAPGGAAAARNLGIARARTDLVALLDDDDEWLPTKIEEQLPAFAGADNRLVVACQATWLTDTGAHVWPLRGPREGERLSDYLFVRNAPGEGLLATPTLVLPTALARHVPMSEDERVHEDLDWLLRLERAGARVEVILRPLVIVDGRGGRQSLSSTSQWRRSLAWARARRDLLGPRAQSAFVLTEVARLAAANGASWRAAPAIALEAAQGRPRLSEAVRFAVGTIAPPQLRDHLARTWISPTQSTAAPLLTEAADRSLVQVVPHQGTGGMQRIAATLDRHLRHHRVNSAQVFLDDVIPSRSAGRIVGGGVGWLRLVVQLRQSAPAAVVGHAPRTGIFSSAAAFVAGVPVRAVVLHEAAENVSAPSWLLLRTAAAAGVLTDVVFVGNAVATSYHNRGKGLRRKARVIRNGLDLGAATAEVSPERLVPDRRDGPVQLLTVCRLIEGKNLEMLLRALAAAQTDPQHHPPHLVVCGDGPEREALEELCARLDLCDRVHLLGDVPPARVHSLYAGSDAFLFPSRSEGFPLVLIEAAVHGLPVVASDLAANREAAGDDATYVQLDDLNAWAQAIFALSRPTAEVRAELRAVPRTRARARARVALDEMVAGYAALVRGQA